MSFNLIIDRATQILIDHVDELTALDQAIGDGDHGLNMRRGAQAIQAKKAELDVLALNDALKLMGKTCLSVIGGSSGPVFGVMLKTLGDNLPVTPSSSDLAQALQLSIQALTRLGKAEVGQKTLLDVLDPVQKVLEQGGPNLNQRVRQCALDSSLATANMEATRGRSSFLGDRAKGHVDPGSRSVALIVSAICDCLAETKTK